MKKTNFKHIFIFIFILILYGGVRLSPLDITFEVNPMIQITLMTFVSIIFLFSVYYSASIVHKHYIKHQKTNLRNPRLLLLGVGTLFAMCAIVLDVAYYVVIVLVLLLLVLYFFFLYLQDVTYVKKALKSKISVDDDLANEFLVLLGGKDNIKSITFQSSRLKVECVNTKVIQLEEIKNLGASGIFLAGNKLQAIIGTNAADLEEAIKKVIESQ